MIRGVITDLVAIAGREYVGMLIRVIIDSQMKGTVESEMETEPSIVPLSEKLQKSCPAGKPWGTMGTGSMPCQTVPNPSSSLNPTLQIKENC